MPQCIVRALLKSEESLDLVVNVLASGENCTISKTEQRKTVTLDSADDLEFVAWVHWHLYLPIFYEPQNCDLFFATCMMQSRFRVSSNDVANSAFVCDATENEKRIYGAEYRPNALHDNEFWCLVRCAARLQCKVFAILIFCSDAAQQHSAMLDQAYRSMSTVGYRVYIRSLHFGSIALIGVLESLFLLEEICKKDEIFFCKDNCSNTETVLNTYALLLKSIIEEV